MEEYKDTGWIKLERSVMEHWIWSKCDKFDSFHAWADLLLNVNYKAKKIAVGNRLVDIECGGMLTSVLKLSKRWNWNRKTVTSFLKLLEKENLIEMKKIENGTYIKVLGYAPCGESGDNEGTAGGTTKRQHSDIKTDTNNKDNKEKIKKNENNKYIPEMLRFGDYVNMTGIEFGQLEEEFGEELTVSAIKILDNYKGSSGKEYASDYRAILSWVMDAAKKKRYKDIKNDTGEHDLLKMEESAEEFEAIMLEKLKRDLAK